MKRVNIRVAIKGSFGPPVANLSRWSVRYRGTCRKRSEVRSWPITPNRRPVQTDPLQSVVIVRFRTTRPPHPASHSSKLFRVDLLGQQKCNTNTNTNSNHKESDHNA